MQQAGVLQIVLGDPVGWRWLLHCVRQPRVGWRSLVEAARLILARKATVRNARTEEMVLIPYLANDEVEIRAVSRVVAVELSLLETARVTLDEARSRGITKFSLAFGRQMAPSAPLIAEDTYHLANLPHWLAQQPESVARLMLGAARRETPSSPASPSSETHSLAFLSAAARFPDLVPLLHDVHRRQTGAEPAPPFDRSRVIPYRLPAEPRRRSVLFLHQNYYNFKYLANGLRERGWDAVVVNLHPPDGPFSNYFHGDDLNLFASDAVEFKTKLDLFFDGLSDRFGIVHSYGVGAFSLFPRNWDTEPTHAAIPWDILELRRRGLLIGYTRTGCLDGVSQSAFAAWSPPSCARCPWREQPDICSDSKNLAWGRKLDMLADLVCTEAEPPLDFNGSSKAFQGPLTMALDPEVWRPDLVPPEPLRRPRTRDDEVVVYHGVGNYKMRTRDGVNIKGTGAVVAAIDALREEGIPIRLDFVEDLPSIDNRFVQVQADIIVDQLNYGRYGAIAREGMMLGKPVVARINPWDGDGVAAAACILETPIVNADEETIKDVLRDLALSPAKRAQIGKASREHALKWWSAPRLAERFERVYDIVRETGRPPRTLD